MSSYGSRYSRQIQSRTSNLQDHNISHYKPRATVATSPTSVISQAAIESIISGLQPSITCLCDSEDLKECEAAVLTISKMWKDSNGDPTVHAYLSTSTIVNGFIDVLSASLSREVLRTTVYILSELLVVDDRLREILTNVDLECLAALLKNGLSEAAVLIYLSKPTFSQLSEYDLVPHLIQNVSRKFEDSKKDFELVMDPKDAAIVAQVLMEGDENSRTSNAMNIMSVNVVPSSVMRLDRVDTRHPVMYNRSCRNIKAIRIDFGPVGNEYVRVLWELVQLNRIIVWHPFFSILLISGLLFGITSFPFH